jgi:hypothetical protein
VRGEKFYECTTETQVDALLHWNEEKINKKELKKAQMLEQDRARNFKMNKHSRQIVRAVSGSGAAGDKPVVRDLSTAQRLSLDQIYTSNLMASRRSEGAGGGGGAAATWHAAGHAGGPQTPGPQTLGKHMEVKDSHSDYKVGALMPGRCLSRDADARRSESCAARGGPAEAEPHVSTKAGADSCACNAGWQDLTFRPDINEKSRKLDAHIMRGEQRQPRYKELYQMTEVCSDECRIAPRKKTALFACSALGVASVL